MQSASDYSDFFPFRLNAIQRECLPLLAESDQNALIAAPTGAGKTALFELALIRAFGRLAARADDRLAVYLAPVKALCQERAAQWRSQFAARWPRLCVQELTGDSAPPGEESVAVQQNGLIVATPEKFNAVLRRWREFRGALNALCLVMVDEVHTLGEEGRGGVLEAVITRLKLLRRLPEFAGRELSAVRFVGVSATVSSPEQLGRWLCAEVRLFGEETRPVPLEKLVLGFAPRANAFLFDLSLNFRLFEVLLRFAENRSALVFCATQKSAAAAAIELARAARGHFVTGEVALRALSRAATQLSDSVLQVAVTQGVGYHHAGLSPSDRGVVEALFRGGELRALATTCTLALGVNLPAFLVVVKGTKAYRAREGYVDYPLAEVLQMGGRAGRPGMEDRGRLVLMTDRQSLLCWETKLRTGDSGQSCESRFERHLADNLNNEIALRTVKCVDDAEQFFRESFAWTRCDDEPARAAALGAVRASLDELSERGLLLRSGVHLSSTALGLEFARQNFAAENVSLFAAAAPTTLVELLELIAKTREMDAFAPKLAERRALKEIDALLASPARKGGLAPTARKAFVLLQAFACRVAIAHWELKRQISDLVSVAFRALFCYKRFCVETARAKPLIITLRLLRCLRRQIWETQIGAELLQIEGVKAAHLSALAEIGIASLADIRANRRREALDSVFKRAATAQRVADLADCVPVLRVERSAAQTRVSFARRCAHVEHAKAWIVVAEPARKVFLFQCLAHRDCVVLPWTPPSDGLFEAAVIGDWFLGGDVERAAFEQSAVLEHCEERATTARKPSKALRDAATTVRSKRRARPSTADATARAPPPLSFTSILRLRSTLALK